MMKIQMDERKQIIIELQKLAEEVRDLKAEHRQKRPIVIEFSGSPKAGKTSCINSLELFLKRNGFSVQIVQERASVCPVSDKQSPMFNLWTACMSLAGLIGTLENKKNQVDVLILDRGVFDALCWFEWLVSTSKMEEEQRKITEQFLLANELVSCIDIVFAFRVQPNISIEREYATLLTDKLGTIMNEKVLGEYLKAIEHTYSTKSKYFHRVFEIDTSRKNQDEVGKEVTEATLDTLKYLLMERVGYFAKNDVLMDILKNGPILYHSVLNSVLPKLEFDLRNNVEKNSQLLQPLPVAIITNKAKDKVLVIKKNKSAVSSDSPERDRILLYVGGHSRYEDATDLISNNFLTICKTALKREIKEEIGISVALDEIIPLYIYTPTNEISSRHLAVCFLVSIDEDGLKLHLDPQELILNKGRSKSGRFFSLLELAGESDYEEWSKEILRYCFDIEISDNIQSSLFNL
ncbi:NUDIX hydrolase [Lawsonibacter sp. JLR.KK007]|jgi:predicted NUDIX family phosphoesterase/predicted ATPase|uniref:NUDIX hydrolase n=1 Tax=Lawsonibacter sp. JLR.KK007 TaxID=3114293 RepID=UPI002FEF7D09